MPDINLLPLPKSGIVTDILHVSDIHIRSGDYSNSRYKEYFTVFNNLITSLESRESVKNNTAIIIITGDTFHHKNKAESTGISLFNYLLSKLGSLAPVFIISGNHDMKQVAIEEPDMLKAFLEHNQMHNITYLEETGNYILGDIGFGFVNIRDTLRAGDTSGQVDELPEFPSVEKFPDSVKITVALFHGTVINGILDNYTASITGYPLKWFKGYNYGLFGDIHLRQVSPTITAILER